MGARRDTVASPPIDLHLSSRAYDARSVVHIAER
jgi:hypothetical protein